MLKRILLFVVLPLGLLTLLGYYWLGGFNEITISVEEEDTRLIAGKPYRGQYGDLALRQLFVETQQLQAEGTLPGVLTVVNLDSASADGQSVNQLIGVALTEPFSTLPSGYQIDTLPAGRYLRAALRANSLVMPQPRTINERIDAYADSHQLTVQGLPIEFYRTGDTLWIERAVR